MHIYVLERPQGTQRCLLCVGEASDARDIESLVGAIPPQRLEMLATVTCHNDWQRVVHLNKMAYTFHGNFSFVLMSGI